MYRPVRRCVSRCPPSGLYSYVAVRGGVATEPILGSRSTDEQSGIGRALRAGDLIPVGRDVAGPPAVDIAPRRRWDDGDVTLVGMFGPRDDWFTDESLRRLTGSVYTVTADSNRVGVRLTGPTLDRRTDDEMWSEPTLRGAVEVPPDGLPIVFGADHLTTCGYPVVAVLHPDSADRIAQCRPGQQVRFSLTRPRVILGHIHRHLRSRLPMTSRTGPQAIAAALARSGTRYLFGMPGGGNNLDVIGACEAAGIEFVLAHTETGAAIMATAHAELTGSVGACVVTRGPGAASAVNGAAQANQDRQPLLVLCDTVDVQSSARIAHQNIDQRAMFAPVTKWSTTLGGHDPDAVMADAVAAALSPPRGAVHLDVDAGYVGRDTPPRRRRRRRPRWSTLAALIDAASRPVLVVGVGARPHADDHPPPRRRHRTSRCSMTYKARGVVPDSGPNSAGPFTGARTESAVLDAADLIVTIGLDSIELIPNPWDHAAPVISLAEYPDPYRYLEPEVT